MIPFVVIVQPHLLKTKKAVRLRSIAVDSDLGNNAFTEELVELQSLASRIKEKMRSTSMSDVLDFVAPAGKSWEFCKSSRKDEGSVPIHAKVDCIYVGVDQFHGTENLKHGSAKSSAPKKALKAVHQRIQTYFDGIIDGSSSSDSDATSVVAADIPYPILREFGTSLILLDGNANRARDDLSSKYPIYKKAVKNLSFAIENLTRRKVLSDQERSHGRGNFDAEKRASTHRNIFLYSTIDDKFDLVSLKYDEKA